MAKGQLTEIQIISGCIDNDRHAQEALYRKYFSSMMAMLMKHTSDKNLSMEILNNGMLRVFQKIDQYEQKGSLEGWIRRIVYHALCNHFQSNSNYIKYLILEDHDAAIPPAAEDQSKYDNLLELINSLPAATAKVFKLYAIEGYRHREISDILGISIGTSKWHLSEARKQLKEKIMQSENYSNYGA